MTLATEVAVASDWLEVHELDPIVADAIDAIDVIGIQYGNDPGAFIRTSLASGVGLDGFGLGHLNYDLTFDVSQGRNDRQADGGGISTRTSMTVPFVFRLRAGEQVEDRKRAYDAGARIRYAITRIRDRRVAFEWVDTNVIGLDPSGEYLLIEPAFTCLHEVRL